MRSGWWTGRRVMITGHTGFKGAWLTLWLERLGARTSGLALPPEDPRGAFTALSPWPGLESHLVDLRDPAAVAEAIRLTDPEVLFHLGAQALVRRGYADPIGTFLTNVIGTVNVLEASAVAPSLAAVVVVTSDKVYEARDGLPAREGDPFGGDDPYSSSKVCAETVVRAWRSRLAARSVGIATARAGNVIGGGDRGEDRLLPDAWRALEAGRPLLLRYPDATRPWQHVLDPLWAYLLLARRLAEEPTAAPEAVNVGPGPQCRRRAAELAERVFALFGEGCWEVDARSALAEVSDLRLDATLARDVLGWRPRLDLDEALEWTVAWWKAERRGDDLRTLALAQIADFEARG